MRARTTSRYDAVYLRLVALSADRSGGDSSMLNGLLLGMQSSRFDAGKHNLQGLAYTTSYL